MELAKRGRRSIATPAPADTLLWQIRKDSRRATLHLRQHPLGVELRSVVESTFVWSQVVKTGADVAAISDEHLRAWLDRGWTLDTSADTPQ